MKSKVTLRPAARLQSIRNWGSLGAFAVLLVIGSLAVMLGQSAAIAATITPPVNLIAPIKTLQLQGGFSFRASPKIADVCTTQAGLEIVVGSAATNASQGSLPASVAVVKFSGNSLTKVWERLTYTYNSQTYQIGTIMGTPAVADLDGDNQPEIVVGMGGFSDPVTRGGILALNGCTGETKWYVQTKSLYDGNAIPDGVYASPSVADFDGDGRMEVVAGGFDHHLWLIDGPTGAVESGFPIHMWDTINSSTAVADLDNDGYPDFTFGGDFTNTDATSYRTDDVPQLPPDGGVMRGMKYRNGQFYLPGWDQCISSVWPCIPDTSNNNLLIPIGQWTEQVIFSSPAIGDINKDGELEIAVGSGYYWSPQTIGHWVKIWQADGTLLKTLTTEGVTFASPALADLNGDGYLDIVVGDMKMGQNSQGIFSGTITGPSKLYAWSGNPADNFAQLWSPKTIGTWRSSSVTTGMFSSPVVADIDPSKAGPEILFGLDTEIVVFNGRTGEQLTYVDGGASKPTLASYGYYENSPAVADIDSDGQLEIVVTNDVALPIGTPRSFHQHVIVWRWPGAGNNAADADLPWPQFRRDAANHAAVLEPALGVSSGSMEFLYQSGSGAPNPTSSLTIKNMYNSETMNYSITSPATYILLGAAASGSVGPGGTVEIPFTVLANNKGDGTYNFNITVSGSSNGSPLQNSPTAIPISLFVGDVQSIYLPIIVK